MDPNLLSRQQEVSNKRRKEKKSKKDKKRKLAAEAEQEAAAEEAAKSSKKRAAAKEESGQGGGVEKSVAVTGKGFDDAKYAPFKSFAAAALPPQVLDCCKGFQRPSPIQALAWPYLLDGRDLIGIAATGSGKTIAFGVPALMHVRKNLGEKAAKKRLPRCLMLAPTRELAQQIADVLTEAGAPCGINSVCLYGGTSKGPQISALKSGVEIVIGTPGRMKDLIEMGACHLNEVSFVVLDEADRMLDMGFEPEVRAILSQTSSERQMVMFSATWPFAVHQLAQEFMDPNPIKVVVGSEDLAANHDVMQIVEVLDDRARDSRLVALLDKYHRVQSNRVLVFVLYKKEAARVEAMLNKRGWKAVSIHGDKAQHDRTKALSLFKEGTCPLMMHTKKRNRLLHKRLNDLVFVSYNRKMKTRFQIRREKAGKSCDPLVMEDFDWDNEWTDSSVVPLQGSRGCVHDLTWEDVDEAVGASRSLRGRLLPRQANRPTHRETMTYQRRVSNIRMVVEEDEETLDPHNDSGNEEDEEEDPHDDADVSYCDEALNATEDGENNNSTINLDEFDDGY